AETTTTGRLRGRSSTFSSDGASLHQAAYGVRPAQGRQATQAMTVAVPRSAHPSRLGLVAGAGPSRHTSEPECANLVEAQSCRSPKSRRDRSLAVRSEPFAA